MELFIHPWYMAAGGALISSPILIHLINRMRFKRIRWAAMEFLLKSQKRNRRRLIIEQLILLLLRILLVLLAAFLVARFLFAGTGTKGAAHVVIVDDTLSMADRDKQGGKDVTAYETGLDQIRQVVRNAAQAASEQQLRVYLLSELDKAPLYEGRISNRTVEDLDTAFVTRARKPTFLHVEPLDGLKQGRELLNDVKDKQKVLHYVSDFRDKDWAPGSDGDKLVDELKAAMEAGINVNLIDVAAPFRGTTGKVALNHDNLAIVDFVPNTRVAVEDTDVEFTVKVMNYGSTEGRGFLKVYINGQEDLSRSQVLERLPAGREFEHRFTLRFPRLGKAGQDISEKDSPEERERKRRLQRDYFHVRVDIGAEQGGLNADNVRDLVLEVRRKVPILVVDGNRPEGRVEGGDLFHLAAFDVASSIYDIEERKAADLEKADLDLYPSIILLNVAELSPPVVTKLKNYVEQGGSLCYFLGEEVKADHYNGVLYKNGLFPLLITERPFDPLQASFPDLEARKKERERVRQTEKQPKVLFTDPKHPLTEALYKLRPVFRFMSVNVYWKAQPRSQWDPEPRKAESLIVLPNTGSVDTYKAEARNLVLQAIEKTKALAAKEVEFQKYLDPVAAYDRKVTVALASGDLFQVAEVLENLLYSEGVKDNPDQPNMPALWKPESMKTLHDEIKEFRDKVLYGDPLLVSRRTGKGRVVALLTTAGTSVRKGAAADEDQVQWNNWGAGDPLVSYTYPIFQMALHRYLISEGQAPNRVVGEPMELQFDASRYDRKATWTFTPQPELDSLGKPAEEKDNDNLELSGKTLTFRFRKEASRRPGVYRMQFTLLGEGAEEDRKETRAFAFNVDATSEGDLKRATRERLEVTLPGKDSTRGSVVVRSPASENYETFRERTPDASESPWLYLFFLVILIVEQAMAVHLSFHLKGSEAGPGVAPSPATA